MDINNQIFIVQVANTISLSLFRLRGHLPKSVRHPLHQCFSTFVTNEILVTDICYTDVI